MSGTLLEKFVLKVREHGVGSACAKAASWLIFKGKAAIGWEDQIQQRRLLISRQLDERFGSCVKYGPFRGLKLSKATWWGTTDRAGMLLGLYEQEVLSALANVPLEYRRSFIELGAADGYYAVGVLVNGLFDRSYCFEISERGQKAVAANAELNGVSSRVQIYGIADQDFHATLPPSAMGNSTLLIDIEGAEFDILTPEMFERFSRSVIIVELHDHFFADAQQRIDRLGGLCANAFRIDELTTTARDLSVFAELKQFCDTDRWLICSEGRRAMPHWYVLTPLAPQMSVS
jgi:hypothetical protein